MAMNHLSKLWMNAEDELVERVARRLAARHGAEIFGPTEVTLKFLDARWRAYECDARDCIVEVRCFDRGLSSELDEERAPSWLTGNPE